MKTICSIAIIAVIAACSSDLTADHMKAFPPAEQGMVRHVLQLPKQATESDAKVELIVGKTVQIDESNHYFFPGSIQSENIEGWGYTRYVVSPLGPMGGTLMAVNPNAPKVDRFITIAGEPYLIRYNSRLPVVVYAPEGVDVHYRIWRATPESKPIEEG